MKVKKYGDGNAKNVVMNSLQHGQIGRRVNAQNAFLRTIEACRMKLRTLCEHYALDIS